MCRILQFFVVSMLILHNFEHVNGDKYQCNFDYFGWCDLKDLKLTRDNYEIVPVAANLRAVGKIVLYGTVPVLSAKEICKAMPNLEYFKGDEISLEEILEEAFENCNKLTSLVLEDSKIFKIGRNSFKGLSNLKKVWISGGNLPTFDVDLTDLKKLTWLRLKHLNIMNFRAELLREQTNLEKLDIESNNLFDLNIEEIIKNKPKLIRISLNDNNFKCSRLTEILNLLKDKSIEAPYMAINRIRSYTPNEMNGFTCLTDEQWESEFIKLPLEQQLLHNQEINIIKPNLTLSITKLETSDKNQQESVFSFDTKINDALKMMRNESMNLLEIRDEKFLNLQNEHTNLKESYNEEITNIKKNIRTLSNIYQDNELTNRKELEGLIEDMDTIDVKILNLEANQTEQSVGLKSLETKMESKLEVLDDKISKVTETLETITNKLEAKQKEDLKADGQMTEITKSLEKINAKIDAQDAINLKMQENMNKFMETLSNLLVSQSSTNNMMDQKMKSLKDEIKEDVKKVVEQMNVPKSPV